MKDVLLDGGDKPIRAVLFGREGSTDFGYVRQELRAVAEAEAKVRFQLAIGGDSDGSGAGAGVGAGSVTDFGAIVQLLRQVQPKPGSKLAVLGGDVGSTLVAAALLFDFAVVQGVEPEGGVSSTASIIAAFRKVQAEKLALASDLPTVQLVQGTVVSDAWLDSDVVVAKSTAFDDSALRKLAAAARRLKPGAIVITFSHELPEAQDAFDTLDCRRVATTFGTVTAYLVQRKRLSGDRGAGAKLKARGPHADGHGSSDSSLDGSDDDGSDSDGSGDAGAGAPATSFAAGLTLDIQPVRGGRKSGAPWLAEGLGSPSSPQGNSLLQAKAARAAAQRSALSRPPLAAGPPSPGFSPSTADGAAHSGFGGQGQDQGVGSGQPIRVQAPVAALVADAGLAAQSSPQGSDLLSIKAARAARAAQGKKSALGRQ